MPQCEILPLICGSGWSPIQFDPLSEGQDWKACLVIDRGLPSGALSGFGHPLGFWLDFSNGSCKNCVELEFPYVPTKVTKFATCEQARSPFFRDVQWGSLYTMSCVPVTGATVATWVDNAPETSVESLCGDALASLQEVVKTIAGSRPLPMSPDLDELLTRAAALRGAPSDDIEAWARQIAEDVGDLTD